MRDQLALRVGIFGSERWGDAMRRRIEETLGVETFDIYGMTELYGPGVGIECPAHDGIHYWSDYFVVEVVDPDTLEPVPDGDEGELVLTTLRKEATPLLRYRTRDLSRVIVEPCACGSPFPRIARLTGRTDDMVKVRGVAVFPSHIDTTLAGIAGVGSEYQLQIDRVDAGHDELLLRVEVERDGDAGGVRGAALRTEIEDQVHHRLGLRVTVELLEPGTLPRSERKTQRVFDHRDRS